MNKMANYEARIENIENEIKNIYNIFNYADRYRYSVYIFILISIYSIYK